MKKLIAFALASMMTLFLFTGCSSNAKDTVMTVNGSEVSWDEYMYWLGYAANQYRQQTSSLYGEGGVDLSDEENFDIVAKYAKEAVTEQHVILSKAKELDITVKDKEVQDVVDSYVKSYVGEEGTEEDLAELIKESYSTIGTFKSMIKANLLYSKIIDKLYGEGGKDISKEQLSKYAKDNDYITATHILLLTVDDERKPVSDAKKAELKAQAQGFVDELTAISDDQARLKKFNELKKEFCQDTGKETYPDGYCFTKGTMVNEFDSAARELEAYQISEVVESSYGYHVIMRLPLKGTDLCSGSNGYPVELRALVAQSLFNDQFEQWKEEAKVKFVGKYKNYDFSSLFTKEGFQYKSFADMNEKDK